MLVRDIIKDNADIYVGDNYIENPTVTIILPTYSRAKSGSLERALDSYLNQTYDNFELIIVDDASTDGSFDICKRYMEKDNRIKIIRHRRNIGLPAISTYEAYKASKGLYFAFAFAFAFDDNTWEEDAIEKTLNFYKKNNVKAGYGITRIKDPVTEQFVCFGTDSDYVDATLSYSNCIGEGSVVLHREVLEDVGLFDPHLSLTRICDWDLWQRLIKKYDFVATGIDFAIEYGVTMSDSLGNTRPLHSWFYVEYQQHRKDCNFLKPEKYENAEIYEYFEDIGVTSYYANKLMETSLYYKDKFWYKPVNISQKALDNGHNKRRIVVIGYGEVTASFMSFFEYTGNDFIISFAYYPAFKVEELLLADIVVEMRALPDDNWVLSACKAAGIPIYYYADDNFREIYIKQRDIPEYRNTNADYLKDFSGVIVSSYELVNYFKDYFLHDNLIYLPPILSGDVVAENSSDNRDDEFTIGYMGGKFRENVFVHYVVPAILKLAGEYKIKLVLPEDDALKLCFKHIHSIEIAWYRRETNYIRVLNKIKKIGIDLLVHTGEHSSNNKYKTKNCLANAVLLDANLITSDIEPYNVEDDFSNGYLTCENTSRGWTDAIRKIITEQHFAKNLLENAKATCGKLYSTETGWKDLTKEFLEQKRSDDVVSKAEILFEIRNKLQSINLSTTTGGVINSRDISSDSITYRPIERNAVYRFTPYKMRFSKVVLAFARDSECQGNADIYIKRLRNDEILAGARINIQDMVKDGLTTVVLDQLVDSNGADLLIDIRVNYLRNDLKCGVFEVVAQRSFIYKTLNKVGVHIHGRNVIWIDTQ